MAAPEFPPAGTSSSRAGSANDGAQSSPHPFEQARPHAPRQQHKRISVVALEHEQIVFAEPAFDALNAITLPAMASTAHGRPRISASASLARVKFTMSEGEPSERFSRYMPGKRLSGTMAT
jgi:hypothetical protein